jgi:acyl-CoA thioesterase FadM
MSLFYIDRISQFSETDAAGIVHFSKIACYVEEAEHAFFAQAGYPIQLHDLEALRWPRVEYKASYGKPIFPFQAIRVHLKPLHIGTSSIKWNWSIKDGSSKKSLCGGEMKSVCCVVKNGKVEVCPIPSDLRDKLFMA